MALCSPVTERARLPHRPSLPWCLQQWQLPARKPVNPMSLLLAPACGFYAELTVPAARFARHLCWAKLLCVTLLHGPVLGTRCEGAEEVR